MNTNAKELFINGLIEAIETEITMGRCPAFTTGYAGIVQHAENIAEQYYDDSNEFVWSIDRNITAAIIGTKFWLKNRH